MKPIVVSTERPSSIAHKEAPAPRWQLHQPVGLLAEQFGGATCDVGVRQSVEAELAQRPALAPGGGQRVGGGVEREVRVKGGVEAGDRRRVGQELRDRVERRQRAWLVQWREVGERFEPAPDLVVDQHGRAKAFATVDDAVADGIDLARLTHCVGQRRRSGFAAQRRHVGRPGELVAVEHTQFEAARACIDDQDTAGGRRRRPPAVTIGIGHLAQPQSRTSGMSSPCSRV